MRKPYGCFWNSLIMTIHKSLINALPPIQTITSVNTNWFNPHA